MAKPVAPLPARRIRYSVAMSLDGYIAGPNGESEWIVMDPEIDFRALMNQFDTILLGRKTYDAMRSQKGAGGGMPGMTTYLFSRTLQQKDHPDVIVVSENAAQVLKALKKQPGKDIWLFGGGGLFASLLDAAVVDAIEVAVIPVMLGAGRPLLPSGKRTKLQLTNQRTYKKTGTVLLEYAVTALASRAASPSR